MARIHDPDEQLFSIAKRHEDPVFAAFIRGFAVSGEGWNGEYVGVDSIDDVLDWLREKFEVGMPPAGYRP